MFEANVIKLFNQALVDGLVYPGHRPAGDTGGSFYLDGNRFSCECPRDPETVLKLVLLVREYADIKEYGPHTELLGLVAQREELEQLRTRWFRAYHVNFPRDGWVTLKEWLAEKGHPYEFPIG